MTKIILSTGDKYTLNIQADEVLKMLQNKWIFLEDDSRDIAIKSAHIIAIEEDTAAIIKEAEQTTEQAIVNRTKCCMCGVVSTPGRPLIVSDGKYFCQHCYINNQVQIKYLETQIHV